VILTMESGGGWLRHNILLSANHNLALRARDLAAHGRHPNPSGSGAVGRLIEVFLFNRTRIQLI